MGILHGLLIRIGMLAHSFTWLAALLGLTVLGGFTAPAHVARRPTSTGAKAAVRMGTAIFNIADYGAVGDAKTLNTKAIQAAVDACAAEGGGQVVMPGGVFVSGPIFLKSNVEFHVSAGAVLRGSRNFDDYPLLSWESHGIYPFRASLLTGFQLKDVSITGSGVIDGQGDAWWSEIDAGRGGKRPVTLYFYDCERVRIDGVTVMNSPSWTILPQSCRDVTLQGITIKNPWKLYHNCDGIDPVSCYNVHISNCYIDTGDDGIVLKTVPGIPCENITIADCVVEHAHGGVVIGSETAGGVRNVAVNNCIFDGTRSGVFIKESQNVVEDVRINNIITRRVELVMNLSSQEYLSEAPKDAAPPIFRNIHFSNITATQARIACQMGGMPKAPVRNISFSNLRIEADKGFDLSNAEDISLDNVTVTCPGPALQAKTVRNLELQRFSAPQPQADVPVIQLTDVADAWIHGCTAAPGTGTFVGLVGDGNRDIVLEANRLAQAKQAQAPVQPASSWSSSAYAYSGSCMWKAGGERNIFLPVPSAVWATIQREWPQDRVRWGINGIHRMESGAHPDVMLETGDRRRIYIILAWQVDEQLLILEDGTLLRKAKNFNWQLP